jgi:hypothetical protein
MNGRILRAMFWLLNPLFKKNKLDQKLQREKLYNLHTTANFTVAIFGIKIDKILSDQNFDGAKSIFFSINDEFIFFLFYIFFPDMLFI